MTDLSVPKGIRDFVDSDKCQLSDDSIISCSYEGKIARGEYLDALKDIDSALEEDSLDVVARLCWIECQLRVGEVPVTALTAPLEELSDVVSSHSNLLLRASKVFMLAGLKLIEREQTRLAVFVLQHSFNFARNADNMPINRQKDIKDFFITVIKEEINRAEVRREKKAYIAGLQKQLLDVESKIFESKASSKQGNESDYNDGVKNSKKPYVFNSKSIVKDASETDVAYVLGDEGLQERDEEIKEGKTFKSDADDADDILVISADTIKAKKIRALQQSGKDGRNSKVRGLKVFLWCILLFFAGCGAWFFVSEYFPKLSNASLYERLALDSSYYMKQELLLPRVLRRVTDGGISSNNVHNSSVDYTAVKERLDKLQNSISSNSVEKNKAEDASSSSVASTSAEGIKIIHPRQDIAASIQADLDRQHTQREAQKQKDFEENKPNLDVNRLSQTVVDTQGDDNERRVAVDKLTITGDGRVYGQPQSNTNVDATGKDGKGQTNEVVGRSPVDGSPVKPYEVKEFKGQTYYRTITSTEVFSSPSLLAHSLARLEKGAKIEAVAQLGLWLEVVSQKGRKGYIYAQDAVKIENNQEKPHQ